ncbi:MAG: tetratricopeptide repeat protein [Pirellulales bacterium]|nr:tetratricopeptide repeat protein [Pirellulales bacterium]
MRSRVMMVAALVASLGIAWQASPAAAQFRAGRTSHNHSHGSNANQQPAPTPPPASRPAPSFNQLPPGWGQGQIHNPASPRYIDMQPNGLARRGDYPHRQPPATATLWNTNFCNTWGNNWGNNGWNNSNWCGSYPSNCFPNYNYCSYWLPPAVMPAQYLYGPFAGGLFGGVSPAVTAGAPYIQNFVVENPSPPANVAVNVGNGNANAGDMLRRDAVEAARPIVPRVQVATTNNERRAKSLRFIGHGDTQFEKGEYRQAAERYRMAIKAAPDLSEPHVRLAQALFAQGRYADAVTEFRSGSDLHLAWEKSAFRFEKVYGRDQASRMQHLKELGAALLEQENKPDLLYLMGLTYYFSGQPGQSREYFQRATELSGGDPHIDRFIREIDRRATEALAAQGAGAVEF